MRRRQEAKGNACPNANFFGIRQMDALLILFQKRYRAMNRRSTE
jgi:hypothetical protein